MEEGGARAVVAHDEDGRVLDLHLFCIHTCFVSTTQPNTNADHHPRLFPTSAPTLSMASGGTACSSLGIQKKAFISETYAPYSARCQNTGSTPFCSNDGEGECGRSVANGGLRRVALSSPPTQTPQLQLQLNPYKNT